MSKWTPEAEQVLTEYLSRVSELSRDHGDDAAEIVEGLSLHVRTEAESHSGAIVTPDDVQKALAALGTPEQVVGGDEEKSRYNGNGKVSNPVAKSDAERAVKKIYGPWQSDGVRVFGLGIPLFALAFEFLFGFMAEMYVDPIPTLWHVAAGIVLLAGIWMTDVFLNKTQKNIPSFSFKTIFFLNGYVLALSLIYAVIYIPTMPISAIAVLGFGGGLLGFAPLFCAISSLVQLRALLRLRERHADVWLRTRRYAWSGVAVVLVLAALYCGPGLLAAQLLPQAIDRDMKTRESAVSWIRNLHLQNELLKACYEPIVRGIGPVRRWTQEGINQRNAYRELYFRVTGTPYNSVPKPDIRLTFRTRPFQQEWDDERAADSEVGGNAVAGRIQGLSLRASNMDANIMRLGDAASPELAYIEWTIEFANASERDREARMQIELPHDAVASRLTLWIDGEEREAAFGGRSQVQNAYQQVAVVQRRDPALLNVCGPDKVMLQCFPIVAQGTMKLKIGITAPLIERDGKAYLRLPYISERNFTIAPEFTHTVWVEADEGIAASAPLLKPESGSYGRTSLRANVTETDLQRGDRALVTTTAQWATDLKFAGALGTQQATMALSKLPETTPSTVCFVIDGSASMQSVKIDWDAVLKSLPVQMKVCAVLAGDQVLTSGETPVAPNGNLLAWINEQSFRGGCDPVPALLKASDWMGRDGVIVWVHGPLPVELSSAESLRQWERRRSDVGTRIFSIDAVPGPNRLLEQCGDLAMVARVPVLGSLESTIAFAASHREGRSLAVHYTFEPAAEAHAVSEPASGHVLRLALNKAIDDAVKAHDSKLQDALQPLAVQARLVTPLSGAVVLQTKQQYAQNGLDPTKDEEAIPGVPEPHEWALMIVVAIVLAFVAYQQRRARRVTC